MEVIKSPSQFGQLGELGGLKSVITHNLGIVCGVVANLLQAAEAGAINQISQAELVRLLTEAKAALVAVTGG